MPALEFELHPKVLGPTITTGTSEIDVGGTGVTLPAPFDGCIAGVKVQAQRCGVATAAESDTAVIRLKSSMMSQLAPFEILAQPANSGIGADIAPYKEKAPIIPVNCPCQKGDLLQITAAELTACTVHLYVTVTVYYAEVALAPQYHSQIGTQTATTTAAGESAANSIIIGAGHSWIKRIYALVVDTTQATGKGIAGKLRIQSSQFVKGGDVEIAMEGVLGILAGAAGQGCTRLTEEPEVNIGISGQTYLYGYFNLALAITTAGKWNYQVMYV